MVSIWSRFCCCNSCIKQICIYEAINCQIISRVQKAWMEHLVSMEKRVKRENEVILVYEVDQEIL